MTPDEYLEALLSLPSMSDLVPKVSRDGRWVAWTWFRAGPAADVFAAPTDGSSGPVRLSQTDQDTYLVSWAPDSRAVIVEQDKDGDERVQLFRIDLQEPLEMVPLTEAEPDYYIRGGQLHPDGRWLVYGANYDFESGQEIEPTWIYRHDLETGERLVLARPDKGAYAVPELNPQGTHILYPRIDLHPAGRQTWLVDIEGKEDREILNFGPAVKTYAHWLPDGQRAVVLVETETHRRLGIWHLSTGEIDWRLDDAGRDIEDAFAPHGSDHIVVVENDQGRVRGSLLDVETGVEVSLPPTPGNLTPLAPCGQDEWVGWYYHSQQPAEVVRFLLADPRPEVFTSLSKVAERTQLRAADFCPAEDFRWRSVDGMAVHGWLYRARGRAKGTLVYVHGGPTWHSQDWINNQIQYLVHSGFNVLDPNYRGSTGYGLPFREAIREDGWGGREQDDIRTGIQALIESGVAAPGKVGITGTSYGGYSSWFAITKFPKEIVAASAPICGMTDLVVDYETTRPDIRHYSEEMMGGSPEQVPEIYAARSPINHLENIQGRLLIVQGEQDPNVTPENVRVVKEGLEAQGIAYEILAFEDEGHGISKPRNQRVLYERLRAFFEEAFRDF